MIEFKNVTRNYSVGKEEIRALSEVSFKINKGEFIVILGPSGSGKSTLLNLLGGMDRSTKGQIIVDNQDITSYSDYQLTNYRRECVGFVFQFYNLIPNLTALENIEMACKLSKSPLSAKETIEAVGLTNRINHFPGEMSGGELQRISIARALCKNPKLLLCDEPTGALDSHTGTKVLRLLQRMSRDYNKTVVVVTHNAAIASIADRIIQLKDGSVENIEDNLAPLSIEEVKW